MKPYEGTPMRGRIREPGPKHSRFDRKDGRVRSSFPETLMARRVDLVGAFHWQARLLKPLPEDLTRFSLVFLRIEGLPGRPEASHDGTAKALRLPRQEAGINRQSPASIH